MSSLSFTQVIVSFNLLSQPPLPMKHADYAIKGRDYSINLTGKC